MRLIPTKKQRYHNRDHDNRKDYSNAHPEFSAGDAEEGMAVVAAVGGERAE